MQAASKLVGMEGRLALIEAFRRNRLRRRHAISHSQWLLSRSPAVTQDLLIWSSSPVLPDLPCPQGGFQGCPPLPGSVRKQASRSGGPPARSESLFPRHTPEKQHTNQSEKPRRCWLYPPPFALTLPCVPDTDTPSAKGGGEHCRPWSGPLKVRHRKSERLAGKPGNSSSRPSP